MEWEISRSVSSAKCTTDTTNQRRCFGVEDTHDTPTVLIFTCSLTARGPSQGGVAVNSRWAALHCNLHTAQCFCCCSFMNGDSSQQHSCRQMSVLRFGRRRLPSGMLRGTGMRARVSSWAGVLPTVLDGSSRANRERVSPRSSSRGKRAIVVVVGGSIRPAAATGQPQTPTPPGRPSSFCCCRCCCCCPPV